MRKKLLLFFLLFAMAYTYAQKTDVKKCENSNLAFTETKPLENNYKVVYFCIEDIKNEEHKDLILQSFKETDYIKFYRIYKDLYGYDRCQLNIPENISADEILTILKQNNVDYMYSSISKKN